MAPASVRRRSGRAPGAFSKIVEKIIRNLSIFGVSWGPLGAPFGEHCGVIFVTFWGPRLRRGSGGLLGRFWGRFWIDFGAMSGGFLNIFWTLGTCFWEAAGHGLGNF